jgi:hypothetical protein
MLDLLLALLQSASACAVLGRTLFTFFTDVKGYLNSRNDRKARLQLIASQDSQVCERVRCE